MFFESYILLKYFTKMINQLFMFDGNEGALKLTKHNGKRRPLKYTKKGCGSGETRTKKKKSQYEKELTSRNFLASVSILLAFCTKYCFPHLSFIRLDHDLD
jgi:hypothetical protein